jgi:hypothetical protein
VRRDDERGRVAADTLDLGLELHAVVTVQRAVGKREVLARGGAERLRRRARFTRARLDVAARAELAARQVRDHDSLAARILVQEHRLFPRAVARVLNGGWRLDGRRFIDAD